MVASYLRRGMAAGLLAVLWDFRLSSLGTQLVFWAGLGAFFGLLREWAEPPRAHRKLVGSWR